jgi:D-inositol-3-phosphate glycosyltransferase
VPRPRLLAVGEGLRATGYGRVMESLLGPLARAFEVVLFAVNQPGPVGPEAGRLGFEVRANGLPGDAYGFEQLPGLLEEIEPDVVLLHRDSRFHSMHTGTLAAYRERRPSARVVAYCPLDWERVPGSLAQVDLLVVYTRGAREVVARAFGEAGLASPPVAVIPHGVDAQRFAPLVPGDRAASRREARRRLFPDEPALEGAFLVLNANRNQKRKRVDLTLRGFAEFAHDRPEALLYLHMGMRDLGWDVPALAASLGVADRLLATTSAEVRPVVTDEHLNLIYNACDVGLNTAGAEGWGLVAFEHAATGAAQVVPAHGACAELWRDRALLVPVEPGPRGARLVSPAGVADALGRLHDDRRLLDELSARASEYARSQHFSWPAIAARWEEALLGCLAAPAAAA